MGADRRVRLFTSLAFAFLALPSTIALAKTLEGTGVTAGPSDVPVAVPPRGATVPPIIVPPSAPPGVVAPAGANDRPATDEDTETGPIVEPQEVWAPGTPDQPSIDQPPVDEVPTRLEAPIARTITGPPTAGPIFVPTRLPNANAAPTAGPLPGRAAIATAESTTTRPRPAVGTASGQTLAFEPSVTTSLSATLVDPEVPRVTPLRTAEASPCAPVPTQGVPSARVVSNGQRAEVTAGRDLWAGANIDAASGAYRGARWLVQGYLLRPDSFEVVAVFEERAPQRPNDAASSKAQLTGTVRSIPRMRLADCDARQRRGIAPGDYVVRYAITTIGNAAPQTLLSPALPARVIAGPTGPEARL